MNLVLLHGAWFDGTVYDEVAHHLRRQGHTVHQPTAFGHGPDGDRTATLQQSADSFVDYISAHVQGRFSILGWSLGGLFVQMVAPNFADRVDRVAFHNAFVLEDGEAIYDTMPQEVVDYFESITDPDDGTITMPYDRARNRYMAEADELTARRIYQDHMFPVPSSMFNTPFTAAPWQEFVANREPWGYSYVHGTMDVAFPPGEYAWWPRFELRLGSGVRDIEATHVGHAAALTDPQQMACRYIEALRP